MEWQITNDQMNALKKVFLRLAKLGTIFGSIANQSFVAKKLADKQTFLAKAKSKEKEVPVCILRNFVDFFWHFYGNTIFTGRRKMFFDASACGIPIRSTDFPLTLFGTEFQKPDFTFAFLNVYPLQKIAKLTHGKKTDLIALVPVENIPENRTKMPQISTFLSEPISQVGETENVEKKGISDANLGYRIVLEV